MGLFDRLRPQWKNSEPDARVAAARELDDAAILVEMAANDSDWFVRHRTFDVIREKFASQENFACLARRANDEEIRRKAVKKLSDQAVLEDVARNDEYRYVRDAAEHRLEELKTGLWGEPLESTASSQDEA